MVPRPALHGVDAVPDRRVGYREVLRSTVRVRSAYGVLGFAAFSIFWSTAALRLSRASFGYSPAAIGMFGLLSAAGVMAANLTGRVERHTHPMPTAAAIALIAVAYAVLLFAGTTLWGIVAGVLILDLGVQGLHVLNQRVIHDVDAAARNRVNSSGIFLTGLAVTALAALLWARVCVRARG